MYLILRKIIVDISNRRELWRSNKNLKSFSWIFEKFLPYFVLAKISNKQIKTIQNLNNEKNITNNKTNRPKKVYDVMCRKIPENKSLNIRSDGGIVDLHWHYLCLKTILNVKIYYLFGQKFIPQKSNIIKQI